MGLLPILNHIVLPLTLMILSPSMNYEIMTKSWSKRRRLDKQKSVRHIEFIDFIQQHDHFCTMKVSYTDGSDESLISRVIFNDIKQHWTVDGMKIAVRLLS